MIASVLPPVVYAEAPCVVAEGPRWNAADGTLYWVDVTGGKYLRHRDGDPASSVETVDPGLGKIGALWLLRDGMFACVEPATAGMPNGMGVYFKKTGAGSVFVIER